jgi:hypothetical protein
VSTHSVDSALDCHAIATARPGCGTAHTRKPYPDTVLDPIGGTIMSEPLNPSTKFKDMRIGEKLVFVAKLCVFCASFGFVFPRIVSD